MARRRLTDLLREEAQKPEDADEAAAQPASDSDTAPSEALKEAEKTIAQLKANLGKSQQREAALESQVADLQEQVEDQQKLVKSLRADLKRTDTLKQDLEEARKDALQLAEANTKLAQELADLKKPAEKPAEKPPEKPAAIVPASAQTAIRRHQVYSIARPVFPNEPPVQPGTLDTGWMD